MDTEAEAEGDLVVEDVETEIYVGTGKDSEKEDKQSGHNRASSSLFVAPQCNVSRGCVRGNSMTYYDLNQRLGRPIAVTRVLQILVNYPNQGQFWNLQ